MRYSVWNFLSSSITLVVEEETKILGTLTIVLDTDCNIPAGSDFKSECEMLRNQGRLIAEATMFACEESPGQMGEVPAVLMALAYRWCLEAGVDDLCMVVNPRHLFFYERVLGFERMGEAKAMNYVEGNAGLFLRLDLQRAKSKSLKSTCAARVITAGSSVGKLCFNRYELTQVEAAVLLDCAPELYFEARPEHQAILEGLYPLACQSLISCYRYVDPLEVGLA